MQVTSSNHTSAASPSLKTERGPLGTCVTERTVQVHHIYPDLVGNNKNITKFIISDGDCGMIALASDKCKGVGDIKDNSVIMLTECGHQSHIGFNTIIVFGLALVATLSHRVSESLMMLGGAKDVRGLTGGNKK